MSFILGWWFFPIAWVKWLYRAHSLIIKIVTPKESFSLTPPIYSNPVGCMGNHTSMSWNTNQLPLKSDNHTQLSSLGKPAYSLKELWCLKDTFICWHGSKELYTKLTLLTFRLLGRFHGQKMDGGSLQMGLTCLQLMEAIKFMLSTKISHYWKQNK